MDTATLITGVCNEMGGGIHRVAVACDHGTSEFIYETGALPWSLRLTEWEVERLVVAHHYAVERCDCTSALRSRYALNAHEPTTTRTT